MEFIEKWIAEDKEMRFKLILNDERFQIYEDTEQERLFCFDKRKQAWCEVEYVAAMEKTAWDNWAFANPRDEDEFTDIIAFCEVSGEVLHDGQTWIVWFDICDV